MADKLLLDIGCGDRGPRPGHVAVDRVFGTEAHPLCYPDNSVDGIVASHILEHFPHGQVPSVLADWFRALKPGGKLKIAVPDFERIATAYLDGKALPTEMCIMGGQDDENDYHKAIFDRQHLTKMMAEAGLVLIRGWESDIDDCAKLPISLNLEGTKPHFAEVSTSAVLSLPRLSWTANAMCWMEGLVPHRIGLRTYTGAFWEQCLTRVIEEVMETDSPDLILTLDYDTVFTKRDVGLLLQLAMVYPEADAIAPIQSGRGTQMPLFTMNTPEGRSGAVPAETFAPDITQVRTAHFGLTLIRTEKLRKLPKPWFWSKPAPDGSWGEGRVDADIAFWRSWAEAGNTVYLANRVPVGHLECMIRWPGQDLLALYQDHTDWRKDGPPKEIWT